MFKSINKRLIINDLFQSKLINNKGFSNSSSKSFCSAIKSQAAAAAAVLPATSPPIVQEIIISTTEASTTTTTTKDKPANQRPSNESTDQDYEDFYKLVSQNTELMVVTKLPQFKKLSFAHQLKFLTEHTFEDSSSAQLLNLITRIEKQQKKSLQREVSSTQIHTKKKISDPYEDYINDMKKVMDKKNYNAAVKTYLYSKNTNDEMTRMVLESLKYVLESSEEFPSLDFDGILRKISFTKFPIKETISCFSELNLFKSLEFYKVAMATTESYLLTYIYDMGAQLSLDPAFRSEYLSFKRNIPEGGGNHAKLLNSLIVSHRREEAFREFEKSEKKANGQFIYYFICGLIKMGYVEKSKLIMSRHYKKLSDDPYYIMASVNMLMAVNQVELAANVVMKCGKMRSIIPTQTIQNIILELGRLKKYKTLREFGEFLSTKTDILELRQLLFNSYYGLSDNQYNYLKDIQNDKLIYALQILVSTSAKRNLFQADQENQRILVEYKLVNIDFSDKTLPDELATLKQLNKQSEKAHTSNIINSFISHISYSNKNNNNKEEHINNTQEQ